MNKHWKNLPKSAYPGDDNMTEFLKKVAKNRLLGFGINHKEWVSKDFKDATRKRRERNRKKSTPSDIERLEEETAEEEDHDDEQTPDDEQEQRRPNDLLDETFLQEDNLYQNEDAFHPEQEATNISNISQLLDNNGINLDNISGLNVNPCFATSTLQGNSNQPRRMSQRQPKKRAKIRDQLSSVTESSSSESLPRPSSVPRPVSPVSKAGSPPPPPPPGPSHFVPRRKPIENNAGCSNFRSRLNVNVGQNISQDEYTDMHIPSNLVSEFEKLSRANTERGLETGGIIAGQQLDGYYQVTHLIIPEQTARSDYWEVQDERQITNHFVYNPDMIMLGLIHTHPNMTSFLSSVDIHALWDYARHNPSLVSIVLAPEKGTSPAFCLTSLGLTEVGKCKQNGFHKHKKNDKRLYREADHTLDDQTLDTIVVDLRMQRPL